MIEPQLPATLVAPDDLDTPAARDNVWVGGAPAASPRVVVRLTVVAGGLDDGAPSRLAEEATHAVLRVAPVSAEHVWVLVEEVADGRRGAGGRVTRLADAQAILGAG